MQSSPINAAQLMMEFLDREQADIGHGIITTEFSRELEQQKLSVDGVSSPLPPPSSSMGNLPTDDITQSACGTREPASCDSTRDNISTQRKKCLRRLVSDGKPPDAGRSKIQDEIHLTSPALLEKVLADLKVPAEARKACTSAEDKQGRLSLRGLLDVLDKQTGDASALTPGKTMGRDVEALLKSLALPQGEASLSTEELVTKPGGLYSLGELRQLLDKVARQVQEARASRATAAHESGRQGAVLAELKQGPGERTISSLPPTRTAPLVASSIPSFVGVDLGEKNTGRTVESPTPGKELHEITRSIREGQVSLSASPQVKVNEAQDGIGPFFKESLIENTKIPVEHLAGVRVLSIGQNLLGDVRDMLQSIPQEGPQLKRPSSESAMALPPGDTPLDSATGSAAAQEIHPSSGRATTAQVVQSPSRLDNILDRAEGLREVWTGGAASIQEDVVPTREKLSKSALSRFDPLAEGDTTGTGPRSIQAASESGIEDSQADGGTSDSHAFNSRSQTFMSYSPISRIMPVNEVFHQAPRAENLSLANPSWPRDVARYIQDLLKERRTSNLSLELEPRELGRLTLRVETRQEEVTASVTAESEKARDILLRNASTLRQNLEEQGLTLGQFLVDVDDKGSGRGQSPMRDRPFAKSSSWGPSQVKSRHPHGDTGIVRIHANTDHLISILA